MPNNDSRPTKLFVMVEKHKRRLEAKFGESLVSKEFIYLKILDNYKYMDPALIDLLLEKLSSHVTIPN